MKASVKPLVTDTRVRITSYYVIYFVTQYEYGYASYIRVSYCCIMYIRVFRSQFFARANNQTAAPLIRNTLLSDTPYSSRTRYTRTYIHMGKALCSITQRYTYCTTTDWCCTREFYRIVSSRDFVSCSSSMQQHSSTGDRVLCVPGNRVQQEVEAFWICSMRACHMSS